MKNILLITRTSADEQDQCYQFVEHCLANCPQIAKAYICFGEDETVKPDRKSSSKIIIEHASSKPSAGLNQAVREAYRGGYDSFAIISKEVQIESEDFQRMVERFEGEQDKLLAVGYRLQEAQEGSESGAGIPSSREEGIRFSIPWNTCILWNTVLFREIIGEFDTLCDGRMGEFVLSEVNPPLVCTFKGMEDGLVLAKAASSKYAEYYAVLFQTQLLWIIPNKPARIVRHRKKMAALNTILQTFITARGYSIEKLRDFVRME